MTAEELAARRPVWIGLADLFLDTDVRIWYAFIARTLAASPYSLDELRRILDDEVTPVLQSNLMDIAGEWAGFDDDWVVSEIVEVLEKKTPLVIDMDDAWTPLAELVTRLRALPEDARLARWQVWHALMSLFMDKNARVEGARLSGLTTMELEGLLRMELWPAVIPGVRRLARHKPERYPTETEVEENWSRSAAARGYSA